MSPATATRVECSLADCVFYTKVPRDHLCSCTHSDKRLYMKDETCPLYRKDWSKGNDQAEALRKRFSK